MPFMNLGVTILYKKPRKREPNMFSFLSPFSFEVWVYMIIAYLGMYLLQLIISRFIPQSDDIGLRISRTFSTQMITAVWWFFTLFIISTYTANLNAFLTIESMETPIESADDLVRQQNIKY